MLNKIYDSTKEFIKDNYKTLIFWICIILLFWIDLPFVVYRPGGVVELSKRIKVSEGYNYDGKISMTYVSMMNGKIPFILASYIIPNWDIEKVDNVTYNGDSLEETIKKDKISTQESIDNAIIASYKLTGNDIEIIKYHNHVILILDKKKTGLKDYDEIISIDGIEVESLDDMKEIVEKRNGGDILNIKVLRDKKEKDVTAEVYDLEGTKKIGVSIITTYDYKTSKEVEIKSKKSESGPSGGLMMALGVYNSLVKEDITHGKKVAGTGTIDVNGNIGEIGGVKYKVLGAIKDNYDVFVCPEENYKEALSVAKSKKSNIKVISAKTLGEAVEKLNKM